MASRHAAAIIVALILGFFTLLPRVVLQEDSHFVVHDHLDGERFREIIAEELEKSDRWRKYFDRWGSRCYVYVSELDELFIFKDSKHVVNNLELNIAALKALGGEYVFSGVQIMNAQAAGLDLLRVFESERGIRRVFLYQVL